ncbi:MAG: C40 family peptidase [Clostridiales bacterium]|nr:C40 family peptidase [Clostridiales bacterium]
MDKTNTGLVTHAAAQLGLPYIYGTYGKVLTADIIRQKAKQYPSQMYKSREDYALKHYIGKRSYDCAGLVKSYMFQETPAAVPKYSEQYDKNVGGLIKACSETGKISAIPELPGLLVFRGTAHVGVYAGKGEVIEAKGFDYGVVKSKLSQGNWDKWGRLSWIKYPEQVTGQKTEDGIYAEKLFKNTSGQTLNIFADSKLTLKIGTLPAGSSCKCLGIVDKTALIKYKVIAAGAYKAGFTSYVKGVEV